MVKSSKTEHRQAGGEGVTPVEPKLKSAHETQGLVVDGRDFGTPFGTGSGSSGEA